MTVTDKHVARFIEYMMQPKMTNRWGRPENIKKGLEYAFAPFSPALDGTYECDRIGCNERVDVAGERCPIHSHSMIPSHLSDDDVPDFNI